MASGRTHTQIALALSVPITGAALYLWQTSPQAATGLAFGGVAGLLLTPDIDQETITIEEGRMLRIPLFGFLWQWGWMGYALRFEHRGISHALVIGTLTRVAFAVLLSMIARYVINGAYADMCAAQWVACGAPPVPSPLPTMADYPYFWGGLLVGWIVQDAGHVIVDYVGLRTLCWAGLLAACVVLAYLVLGAGL